MRRVVSEKVEFKGALGETLAARLDRPAGPVRAYALFAHCFSCSKDLHAASRVARGLALRGVAVLRFDFTGLGQSEGDFANTNFSSNVEDLVKAADYLRERRRAPELIVGHSLGGAAVLAAARRIPELKAVATINAPSDVAHIADNFAEQIAKIEAEGEAEVSLAGRPFTIKRQFLDDIRSQNVLDCAKTLGKACLIAHTPRDAQVSVDHAAALFLAAKHPKTFLSLDDADHLLTKAKDAIYVGEVIAAWADRYLGDGEPDAPKAEKGAVVVRETGTGKFTAHVVSGEHRMLADEPESYGGEDAGPTPYDYLAAGLAACTVMTLRMYANRKELPVDRIQASVRHGKHHLTDAEGCEANAGAKVDVFETALTLEGDLDAAQRARLAEIAEKCPVHRTLKASSKIETTLRG